ncbi:hypothetical protein D9757_005024 [Collybiopsis confluens]|uniref:BTB domain-containing protein n=1 Tax=Collybiopsis confluens TaxID=2823264 RepID=A0A8H5HT14_9AGAR|nr:hypothetical protein D9757_005024 [Collybiopsis confluens]
MEPLDWDLTFQRFAYETGTRFHPAREHPQMPTPPIENDHGPPVHDDPPTEVVVLVKSGSNANLNRDAPDLLLLSSDSVRFYVHSAILLAASDNGFQSLILTSAQRTAPKLPDPDAAILVPESPYVPPLDLLSEVVNRLSLYGLQAHSLIRPGTPFYALLFSHTPFAPMNVYILAASNKLHQLAVTASSHLVSFPLSAITDAMAEAMGSMYLQKLFFLQLERSAALKKEAAARAPEVTSGLGIL